MNEGRELLFRILNNKINVLSNINFVSYTYDGINLVDLSSSLKKDYSNISNISNALIQNVLSNTKSNKIIDSIIRIKDLYVGKKEYGINVTLTNDYKLVIEKFISELDKKLEEENKDITRKDELIIRCTNIINQINNHEIVDDISFIKELVEEYDYSSKSKNNLSILLFITKHNLKLLNNNVEIPLGTYENTTIYNKKIDDRVLDILEKLDINVDTLPNYFVKELKECNVSNVIDVYNLIRKNKVENGGILHLIKKNNYVSKLCLILYSDVDTIMDVLNELIDEVNRETIGVIRNIVNLVIPIFVIKDNNYFRSKHNNFKEIMKLLKDLGINYKDLINKCPLFLLNDSNLIIKILDTLEKYGFDKKTIVNRCYKTLSLNPHLLIINLNILKDKKINITDYAKNDEYKYVLLKCNKLNKKLEYFFEKNLLNEKYFSYKMASKLISDKVYEEGEEYLN